MNVVLMNEVKNETVVDKEVINCCYNICRYYNLDLKIVSNYIKLM